jgi:hypothetical protein
MADQKTHQMNDNGIKIRGLFFEFLMEQGATVEEITAMMDANQGKVNAFSQAVANVFDKIAEDQKNS